MALHACMHAKSLQLCLTLCNPIDGSPPCSCVPGIPQARTLEWVAIYFSRSLEELQVIQDDRSCLCNGSPLQYSCLANPMDGGAWKAAVHGVAESRTQLSDFTFAFHFHALEKEMATHSSVLAWGIPGTGEPGGLPSMGSHRVGHN